MNKLNKVIKFIVCLIMVLAILIILCSLVGCGSGYYVNNDNDKTDIVQNNDRIQIESGSSKWGSYFIITDTYTGRQFLSFRDHIVALND